MTWTLSSLLAPFSSFLAGFGNHAGLTPLGSTGLQSLGLPLELLSIHTSSLLVTQLGRITTPGPTPGALSVEPAPTPLPQDAPCKPHL